MNILLPTDFSENSRNAIAYALDFYKGEACSFSFLNVQKPSEFMLDDFYTAPADATINETILTDNKKELEVFVASFQEAYRKEDYTFKSQVDFDDIAASINQVIELDSIDLIIMGTNGATGASEKIFGSNTLNVVRKANAPVLAIPEGYTYTSLDTILFSSHQSEDISFSKIKPLKDIIAQKRPIVNVLELNDSSTQEAEKDCLAELFKGIPHAAFKLKGLPAAIAIDAFIQLYPVEMHAMFAAKESFTDRLLFGSDTTKISYRSQVPLLIMNKG